MHVGERERTKLRRRLDERGIRVGWFASYMDVKPPRLSQFANGTRRAPDEWWYRAAGFLGCKVEDIRPAYSRPRELRTIPPAAPPAAQDARVAA